MAKHYRWLKAAVPLLAFCLLAREAGSATGSAGYLPAVGPVPMRFQTLVPVVPAMLWPPLLQADKQSMKSETQTTSVLPVEAPSQEPLTNAVPPLTTTASVPAASPPGMVIPFALPMPSRVDQAPVGVVDPQALLSYLLSISTNAPGANVIMPGFIPAAPPFSAPSSHATYESR